MGNQSSSGSSHKDGASSAADSSMLSRSLLTPSELSDIKKWVSREYPWLATINESMLVADVLKPDCPIVQANIEFEMMTGYPSREILGRNCRFLQGTGTNPATIARIREAVAHGQELSVELLNYTKLGVPFVNAFTMYPIHKDGVPTNQLRYFLAIQKDVTHIKSLSPTPAEWTPQEVVVWLEREGMIDLARPLVYAAIDGRALMALDEPTLVNTYLITEPQPLLASIARLAAATDSTSVSSAPAGSGAKLYTPIASERLSGAPSWWNTTSETDQRGLLCVYRKGTSLSEAPALLITAEPHTEFDSIQSTIERFFERPCSLKAIGLGTESGSSLLVVPLTPELWKQHRGSIARREVTLIASPRKLKLSTREEAAFEAIPRPVIILSAKLVAYVNQAYIDASKRTRDEVTGLSLDKVLATYKVDEHVRGFRACSLIHRDGTLVAMQGDARYSTHARMRVITLIPNM